MIETYLVVFQTADGNWCDLGAGNYSSPRGAKQGVQKIWRWYKGASSFNPRAIRCRVIRIDLNAETGKTESGIFAEYPRPADV